MAQEEFRLAGAALLLGSFSREDLARTAAVNGNTAGSWLRRHSDLLESDDRPDSSLVQSAQRGRPKKRWRLRPEAAGEIQTRLEGLELAQGQMPALDFKIRGQNRSLERVQQQLEVWQAALQSGHSSLAERELLQLRHWVRIAWEDCGDLYAAGIRIDDHHLKELAEVEREAGIGTLPEDDRLLDIAAWLGQRMQLMIDRGVSPRFASKALRMRSEVRSQEIRIRFTAAAAGSVVWLDEGLTLEYQLSRAVIENCGLLLDVISPRDQLNEIAMAIEPGPWNYCLGPDQNQAILLGLAEQRPCERHPEIAAWLSGLHTHDCWAPELAPAALYGLRDSRGHNRTAWLRSLDEHSRAALNSSLDSIVNPGHIRREAIRISRAFYRMYVPSLTVRDDVVCRSEMIAATFAGRI